MQNFEEIQANQKIQYPQKLEPLFYKPSSLSNIETKSKLDSVEYSPPKASFESSKLRQNIHKLPPIDYNNTKNNIFPAKTENIKKLTPFEEAIKRKKEAKENIHERKQKLKELLRSEKIIN